MSICENKSKGNACSLSSAMTRSLHISLVTINQYEKKLKHVSQR